MLEQLPLTYPRPQQITHILFDCDNTLVLSEELAFEACAQVANRILEKYNIKGTHYDGPTLMKDFVGMNFRGMMVALQAKYEFKIDDDDFEKFVKAEEDQVIATLKEKAQPCINCMPQLEKLFEEKKYGLAVVSSSAYRRVKASLEKVDQDRFFPADHIFSAATSLEKPTSKPDPAIYLHACKVIGKKPAECVAVEDSKSGTLSAVRAGIPTIGYVGSYETPEKREEMKKVLKETGAAVIMDDWEQFPEMLQSIERSASPSL
ncbi:HAD-like protein [Ascodesmis nigricans]|uniref:HAD-like protein n=1 Tax=Ascodesmis nigricans TaxID=341454 RepID=A0A4S2N7V2_9PEZI|nr:HAD-like protein [Ascodesmis nigricans]